MKFTTPSTETFTPTTSRARRSSRILENASEGVRQQIDRTLQFLIVSILCLCGSWDASGMGLDSRLQGGAGQVEKGVSRSDEAPSTPTGQIVGQSVFQIGDDGRELPVRGESVEATLGASLVDQPPQSDAGLADAILGSGTAVQPMGGQRTGQGAEQRVEAVGCIGGSENVAHCQHLPKWVSHLVWFFFGLGVYRFSEFLWRIFF